SHAVCCALARGAESVRYPRSASNHMHPFVVPIIRGDSVSDCASLSSSQCGDAWYATVAVCGCVWDVASVSLRAASHDAPAGPHDARVWRGGAWRAGAWHGALDALQWSVYLCGAFQDVLSAGRGVDGLTWHVGAPDAPLAADDHGAQ